MKTNKKQLLSFIILLTIFSLSQFALVQVAPDVQAASLWDQQSETQTIGGLAFGGEEPEYPVKIIVAKVVRRFLEFLGIIFLILILWGGYKYMMAGGNEDKVNEAVDQIKQGVIGLVIMLAAYSITFYVTEYIKRAVTGTVW